MRNGYNIPCNIAQTLNLIGDKWTMLILHQLMIEHATYKEIHDNLPGIPTNLLSDRLKYLETEGLITVAIYQSHPPRYQYVLTQSGTDLADVFHSLFLWGERNLQQCHKHLTHIECDHSIELQYYCKQCGKVVSRDELRVTEE
jgi:DNA-binding HxlR family transcriptional regulator